MRLLDLKKLPDTTPWKLLLVTDPYEDKPGLAPHFSHTVGGFKSSPPGHSHLPARPAHSHLSHTWPFTTDEFISKTGQSQPWHAAWQPTAYVGRYCCSHCSSFLPWGLAQESDRQGELLHTHCEAILAFSRAWELPCPNPLSKLSFTGDPRLKLRSTLAPTSLLHKH